MFSPVVTIGGGIVLDSCSATPRIARPSARFSKPRHSADASRCWCANRAMEWEWPDLVARTGLLEARHPQSRFVARTASRSASRRTSGCSITHGWQTRSKPSTTISSSSIGRIRCSLESSKEELRSQRLAGAPPWLWTRCSRDPRHWLWTRETMRLSSHRLHSSRTKQEAACEDRECLSRGWPGGARDAGSIGEIGRGSGPARARSCSCCCAINGWFASATSWCFTPPLSIAARPAGREKGRQLRGAGVQGVDRNLAQVRNSFARISGSGADHAP